MTETQVNRTRKIIHASLKLVNYDTETKPLPYNQQAQHLHSELIKTWRKNNLPENQGGEK